MSFLHEGYCTSANKLPPLNKTNVNTKDIYGQAPIHLASSTNCRNCVQIVLNSKPNVNIQNKQGDTALHLAIRSKCSQIIELISNYPGVDFGIHNYKHGCNPLHISAEIGNEFAAGLIISKAPHLVNSKTNQVLYSFLPCGYTALHIAAYHGHAEFSDYLVTVGKPDVNLNNEWNQTPLMVGAQCGHFGVVDILLKYNPDVNCQDLNGTPALFYAIESKSSGVVNLLLNCPSVDLSIRDDENQNALHCAARVGDVVAAKTLISKSPLSTDAKDDFGMAPLHKAALFGHKNMAEILLTEGNASIDVLDCQNCTPVMNAAYYCQPSTVEYLVEKGSSLENTDVEKNTVLHFLSKSSFNRSNILNWSESPIIHEIYDKINEFNFSPATTSCQPAEEREDIENIEWRKEVMAIAAYLISRGAMLTCKNDSDETFSSLFSEVWTDRLMNFVNHLTETNPS